MHLKAFVDFDGTITPDDVGNALFRRFGGARCEELVAAYRTGAISAVECFRAEAEEVGLIGREALDSWIDLQGIDPEFPGFVRFCRTQGIELTVVSDGLDLSIQRILGAHGMADLPLTANRARLAPCAGGETRLLLEFPHTNAECSRCACCKRNVMLNSCGDDDLIVYVGEGYSDRCPVRYADLVFAKGELQTFCQEENISYFLYRTFEDVRVRLEELTTRRRPHRRTAAEHLRREAFSAE